MPTTDFNQSTAVPVPKGRSEKTTSVLDLRGLDLVTPVDLLSNGHTPFAKNFRLYAQQADDRRVAVSSRKGPGFYVNPLSETMTTSNTSSTGGAIAEVGIITGVHAIKYTATNNNRLTRIDINLLDEVGARGPLLVQVYSTDADGLAYKLLAESSILSGDIGDTPAYATARFVNAIKLVSGDDYLIVLRQQDDATKYYSLVTTTAGTVAQKTDSTLSQLTDQTYAINHKIYTSPDYTDKGAYRFNRDNGDNLTVVAIDQSMYYIDESSDSLVEVVSGLSSDAAEYNFTNGDNKVFWVNGYDELTAWNGVHESISAELVSNGTFEVNTTGWSATGGGTGNAITRSTAQFHSGVASLSVTATAGSNVRAAQQTLALLKDHRYKITYWVKGASAASNSYVYMIGPNAQAATPTNLTTSWQQVSFYYTPSVDVTAISMRGAANDFFVDDISIVDTGIEYIIDTELEILSDIEFHKDRIWGKTAADNNKLIFSENPGNPAFDPTGVTPTTAREQWYHAWLSVSFWHVPRPFNGSPVTSLTSFQDSLTITTQDNKYVMGGYDRGSFNLRQSSGSKGALSNVSVTSDENTIYFVGSDGFYEHNGSSDVKISGPISPLFDACGHKDRIVPVIWGNEVRFYMASQGSSVNDICVIYNKDLKEWQLDTDTFVRHAIYYSDANDEQQLVEFSSVTPVAYYAEQGYNSLGAPIDFEYDLKYDSMGVPGQKKRLKRYYPILQGVDSTYELQLAMDKDFQNSPKVKDILLTTNGAKIGEFLIGDGTLLGGDKSFRQHRQSYSGYAYYWQLRVKRKGVNNRVAFIGAQYSYKTKRL